MTRAALVLGVLLAGSCADDPFGGLPRPSCAPGNARAVGAEWCGLPVDPGVTVDGDVGDWATFAAVPLTTTCVASPCEELVPATLQLAMGRVTDLGPVLAARVVWPGALLPPADPDLRVGLRLASVPALGLSTETDQLTRAAGGLEYRKNGVRVTPRDVGTYWFAWTGDGFEAAVLIAWLPLGGAAGVTVIAERRVAGEWTTVAEAAPVRACWVTAPIAGMADPCVEGAP